MRCRKFALQNAAGERFGLNGETGVYLSTPDGLGTASSPTFADLRHGFFLSTSNDARPQQTFTGTIVFTHAPYSAFRQFAEWLSHAERITLVYDSDGLQEYYRDLSLNFLSKSELNAVGWLEIPISFYCLTPWYLPLPNTIEISAGAEDESMRYDYEYTETLIYGDDAAGIISTVIQGAGDEPGAITLEYTGAATNPSLRLVGNTTGKTYGICSAAITLASTDRLCYSSKADGCYLKKITAGGEETDLLAEIEDLSRCWFSLPINEPCTLTLSADSLLSGTAVLTTYYYYGSV